MHRAAWRFLGDVSRRLHNGERYVLECRREFVDGNMILILFKLLPEKRTGLYLVYRFYGDNGALLYKL